MENLNENYLPYSAAHKQVMAYFLRNMRKDILWCSLPNDEQIVYRLQKVIVSSNISKRDTEPAKVDWSVNLLSLGLREDLPYFIDNQTFVTDSTVEVVVAVYQYLLPDDCPKDDDDEAE